MVLTRLSASLALKRFKRVSRCFGTCSSLSNSCSAKSTTSKDRETKQKIKKKYSDLPDTYLSPTGAPAAPLGEWFAGADSDASNLSEFLSKGNFLFFVLLIFKVNSSIYYSPGESCGQP